MAVLLTAKEVKAGISLTWKLEHPETNFNYNRR
jgi:hypothetical protein